jgi:hypothetical protein
MSRWRCFQVSCQGAEQVELDCAVTLTLGSPGLRNVKGLGVLGLDSDDPVIIHASPLRAKFYRFLG